ncbi:MAG: peptide ABC transporter substrate-binding protein [Gammaproteobacteria bacterium]|nr:MAG: peptide ABC transporter substrate-binding protein [Gammaproteobacteria bacterium]
MKFRLHFVLCLCAALAGGCGERPWNNPYPAADDAQNILYSSFEQRPKHLDPAQSYVENEYALIAQIYEPPLQYHYLKRPYTLIPLTAAHMPKAVYLDRDNRPLPGNAAPERIAYSVYDITIRPGIRYQPHPAFAQDASGAYLYHALSAAQLGDIRTLADFPQQGARELVAADYVYQIKRLAHPGLHSPIFGLMSEYIVGLKQYGELLSRAAKEPGNRPYLDLDRYPLEGVTALDRYTYRIKLHGKYPQLLYWLAMPFFAPVPHEADRFYSQPGLIEKNITLDWYPAGTGPYMLTENNPSQRMVLERNPSFHGETYPEEGEPGDRERGLLDDAGKPLPFIDKVVYSLEKESIPYWNKFLQGYYDASGISSDSFDQAVRVTTQGDATVSEAMQEKGIRLLTSIGADISYIGFNMLDPVVGGLSERARKLRQAISIAVDYEEFISIFLNGRGIPAQGIIPPGIFGYVEGEAGVNPHVYDWVNGRPQRKAIETARRLLAEAGYPDGRDARTGKPLLLHFDTALRGPDDKAYLDWLRKQFQKLDLQLDIRNTDFNRFQEKMLKGSAQIWQWGWNADYPDPENFMFLLYGPNAKAVKNGENAANYDNPEFNKLFERMKNMDNGPERQAIIHQMMDIARRDAPLLWGLHRKKFGLYHAWYKNAKPNEMANNELKYVRIDAELRSRKRAEWNQPVLTPLFIIGALLLAGLLPAVLRYLRKERSPAP